MKPTRPSSGGKLHAGGGAALHSGGRGAALHSGGAAAATRTRLGAALSGRAWHAQSLAYTYLASVALMAYFSTGTLSRMPEQTSTGGWAAVILAFVSNTLTLSLLPMLLLAPSALLLRRHWFTSVLVPALMAAWIWVVYVDCVIYELYSFHFNGLIWNVLTTAGAGDNYSIGPATWRSALATGALLVAVELAWSLLGQRYLIAKAWLPPLRGRHRWMALAGVLLAIVMADKSVYAVGDFRGNTEITRVKSHFLLYTPLTIRRLVKQTIGLTPSPRRAVRIGESDSSLDYPKAAVSFAPGGARPDIIMIVVEGGRFDMLNDRVMPNLERFARENLIFDRHLSAGNSSRFGLFGLLYGLYASYWHQVLEEQRSSSLIDELKRMGYDFAVLSASDLNYPDLRRTAFNTVEDSIQDTFGPEYESPAGKRVERDRIMVDRFIEVLERRGDDPRPLFAFLFHDASHQTYLYPPEHEIFPTDVEPDKIDYTELRKAKGVVVPILNRYKNSLHYVDEQIGRTLDALRDHGGLDNTLVFITGDHGEEFGEGGYHGHNSTFDRWQTQTFMVAHIPGQAPRRIERLTSHIDVVPTIFDYMGVRNRPADYCQGIPMYSQEPRDFLFVGSWSTAAVVNGGNTTVFGTQALAGTDVIVHAPDYSELPDQDSAFKSELPVIAKALDGMQRFLK